MLRYRPQTRNDPPFQPRTWDKDLRVEVLAEMVDDLDLHSFLSDPSYRRQLNDVLACFSDEEFDHFERLYTSRFTIN